jgi:hypothetical protein
LRRRINYGPTAEDELEWKLDAQEKKLIEKGLKPEAFAPFMFDLTQMNFDAKLGPLRLFAYLRLLIKAFKENIYDSLTYTLNEKGLSARVSIEHD